MRKQITIIGSTNVDFITRTERLPAMGESVLGGVFLQTFGGKGANQAVAVARAGGEGIFVTALGDDLYAPVLCETFTQAGLDTRHILHRAGMSCGTALVMIDREGHNYLSVASGANAALLPEDVDARRDLIAASALLVLQMEIPSASTARAIALAAEEGTPVLLNYAPVFDDTLPLSPAIHVLVVNEVEASALSGMDIISLDDARRAAAALRRQGPRAVIITLGADGALLDGAEGQAHVPAFPITPIDTTGAGDTFCGALAVALVEGQPLATAARFASAAAALSVTRLGAQPSIPWRREIDMKCEE